MIKIKRLSNKSLTYKKSIFFASFVLFISLFFNAFLSSPLTPSDDQLNVIKQIDGTKITLLEKDLSGVTLGVFGAASLLGLWCAKNWLWRKDVLYIFDRYGIKTSQREFMKWSDIAEASWQSHTYNNVTTQYIVLRVKSSRETRNNPPLKPRLSFFGLFTLIGKDEIWIPVDYLPQIPGDSCEKGSNFIKRISEYMTGTCSDPKPLLVCDRSGNEFFCMLGTFACYGLAAACYLSYIKKERNPLISMDKEALTLGAGASQEKIPWAELDPSICRLEDLIHIREGKVYKSIKIWNNNTGESRSIDLDNIGVADRASFIKLFLKKCSATLDFEDRKKEVISLLEWLKSAYKVNPFDNKSIQSAVNAPVVFKEILYVLPDPFGSLCRCFIPDNDTFTLGKIHDDPEIKKNIADILAKSFQKLAEV